MTAGGRVAPGADGLEMHRVSSGAEADRPIRVARRRIVNTLWILAAAILALGILHLAVIDSVADPDFKLYLNLLTLDGENVLPAWFSATMMSGAALVMLAAGLAARRNDPANARAWVILAAIFVFLSLDEVVSIHERFAETLERFYDFDGILTFSWVVVAAPLLVIAVVGFIPFLRRLPKPIGRRMAIAGFVFVLGAFGCELIGGYIDGIHGRSFWYWVEVICEEGLEMAGLVLVIGAVLDYLGLVAARLTLDFGD